MSLDNRRACRQWAYETFYELEAGDRRRARRLVAVATGVAMRPAGTVTDVFDDAADREGAYRFLSNEAISPQAVTVAMCDAAARQCAAQGRVFVAVDGSSLSLPDSKGIRGLGSVGAWKDYGRGLQVVTALALQEDGTVIGVCAQQWWARMRPSPKRPCNRRKLEDKETRFSHAVVTEAVARLREHAPDTLTVAVADRGLDCWPVLKTCQDGAHFIVRAGRDRRLADGPRRGRKYLYETLTSQPVLDRYDLDVPSRGGRPARIARMQLQCARVTLQLPVTRKKRIPVELNAILAREVGGRKGQGLHWMLLTTEPIDSCKQVRALVDAYTFRWRIEELHRMWKRGGCDVEDTQLRSRNAIIKWATLHCAVAARALRLTQLARTQPDVPATSEFSQAEIDAAIILRRKRTKRRIGDVPSLGEMVRMVADLGGYTGKSSGGPPGATVIGRGLERVMVAAEVVDAVQNRVKVTNG
jgi:Transposase DNA-binding/Transposase Tn5 dimerisation domain